MSEPKRRGGARPGAGRKKVLPPIAKPESKSVAAAVLEHVDEFQRWVDLIEFTSPERVQLYATERHDGAMIPLAGKEAAALMGTHMNALRFLHEQVNGKAKQAVDVTGDVTMTILADRLAKARQRRNDG